MDGLLLDTERISHESWIQATEDLKAPIDESVFLKIIGMNTPTYRATLYELIGDQIDVDQLIAVASEVYYEKVDAGVPLKPGALACIEWLNAAGIPQSVATSSDQSLACNKLAQHDLVEHFHSIASGDQVSQGKPHPEIFQTAANRMEVPAEECLVFEDSRHGVIGAHAAGARVILVPDLAEHGPDTESLAYEIWDSLEQGPQRFATWRSA